MPANSCREVLDLLADFRPSGVAENADVARLRALLESGGDPWPRSLPLHITASALIVHPPSERVLLRWHDRQQAWIHVGGHGDPGERDPLAIAIRETAEETGLLDVVPWPDDGLQQVAVVPVPSNDREPAHEHADIRFFLATKTPEAVRPEWPGALLRWLSVDDARELTTEANVRELLGRVERLFAAWSRR